MINVGICSYGYSTKVFHAPFIAALPEYYNLAAFVERHGDTANIAFPRAKIYKSCEELFADSSIDVAVVNTPSPTHCDYARKALLAGKHVVVDKPFAASSVEGESLISLARERNLLLTVFHNRRMEGELLAVKEVVDNRLLGRLVEAEFRFERFRQSLNPKRHKEENAPANGIVYELCTHLIDQAIFIFGLPQKVAFADIGKTRDFSQIDDYCSIILQYPNQFRVFLRCSLLAAEQAPAYVLHGTQGSFVKFRSNIQETQLAEGMSPNDPAFAMESPETAGKLTILSTAGELVTSAYASPQASYIEFYRQFGEALHGKAPVPVNPHDAVEGLRIIEAAYEIQRAIRG